MSTKTTAHGSLALYLAYMSINTFQHVCIAVARIGCDLQLFNHVASSVTPVTAQEMTHRLNTAPNLIDMQKTNKHYTR